MNRIYRLMVGTLCIFLLSAFMCGCEKKEPISIESSTSVYATFYPLYAAADLLLEGVEDVHLNCLVQPQDGCLRNYQLSDWDLALLSSSDLVIAGGRGLESFESVLYALGEDGPVVSAVLYNMELSEQRAVNTQEDAQPHWLGPNPHIYLRTDGMAEIVQRAANSLILLDPENEEVYLKNLENAQEQLNSLHSEIKSELAGLEGERVIVMNEALIYAAQEYGLEMDLCYERESGQDMYDADLQDCLKTLQRSDAQVILIEKQAPQMLCEALKASGYRIARMDTLSTRRASEGAEGYFEAQRANVQVVKNAFGDVS